MSVQWAGPDRDHDPGEPRAYEHDYRVITHEPICPECGSFNVAVGDVETGDGITETALLCLECGDAWPLACVCDWSTQP